MHLPSRVLLFLFTCAILHAARPAKPRCSVFFVDDHEVFRTREGVPHQPQYVILSLFCADWESARLDRKKLPESMPVDYVRVYQKSTKK